jgi:hypothetical protein
LNRFELEDSGLSLAVDSLRLLICEAKSDLAKHELAYSCIRFLDSSNLIDLDEVTASIIEYGHG